eukprot:759935-Hanusia_phi.AAC.3
MSLMPRLPADESRTELTADYGTNLGRQLRIWQRSTGMFRARSSCRATSRPHLLSWHPDALTHVLQRESAGQDRYVQVPGVPPDSSRHPEEVIPPKEAMAAKLMTSARQDDLRLRYSVVPVPG